MVIAAVVVFVMLAGEYAAKTIHFEIAPHLANTCLVAFTVVERLILWYAVHIRPKIPFGK